MLPKNSLIPRKQIPYVFDKGESKKLRRILALKLDNEHRGLRLRVIVSKRFDKKATQRNRTKRQIHEAIRKNLKEAKIKNSDIIIIARRSAKYSNFKELNQEIIQILNGTS